MKRMRNFSAALTILITTIPGFAQKINDERMRRDIEVAENVLGTLIRQQLNRQASFFPLEVKGSYQAGYGVTFTLPADFTTPIALTIPAAPNEIIIMDGASDVNGVNSTFEYRNRVQEDLAAEEAEEAARAGKTTLRDRAREKRKNQMDSMRSAFSDRVIDAAKMFILDYSDILTQLPANEKIVVTNQGNAPRVWVNQYFSAPKRTHLSVEATRADLVSFKDGKLSRDQAMNRIKVVNTETVSNVEPDLELLLTMFNRLYRADLSKTFFTENNIYYERLKDFGAIYYMTVYSGTNAGYGRFHMPTLGLEDVDAETRNRKVKEIYPRFEQEMRENILEYGRTVKSLKDDEVLVFQVKMTRCIDCKIPSTLEYTVKGSVLKNFSSGKLDRNAALGKISLKKGEDQ